MLNQTNVVRENKKTLIPVKSCVENDKNSNKHMTGNLINIETENIHVNVNVYTGPANINKNDIMIHPNDIVEVKLRPAEKMEKKEKECESIATKNSDDEKVDNRYSSLNKVAEQIINEDMSSRKLSEYDITNFDIDVALNENSNVEECEEKEEDEFVEERDTIEENLNISSEDDSSEEDESMSADIEESDLEEDPISCYPESENNENKVATTTKSNKDELSPPIEEGDKSSVTTYKIGVVKDIFGNIERVTEVNVPNSVVDKSKYIQNYLYESGLVPEIKPVTRLTKEQRDTLKEQGKLPE